MDENKVIYESYENPDKLENDIIVWYNEDTWFYDCSINWKLVIVDEYGNYFDEEQNPKQVDGWRWIKKEYHRHNPKKRLLIKITKEAIPVIATAIEWVESEKSNKWESNDQWVDGEAKKTGNWVSEWSTWWNPKHDPDLDELYKDRPEDYEHPWQYLNNK